MSESRPDPKSQPPNPRAQRAWESAIDKQIREAQERGDFDNLPGCGKPLHVESWDDEWALAYHVLKQAGETLPWISLGKEIELAQERLRKMLRDAPKIPHAERERARERYLREVTLPARGVLATGQAVWQILDPAEYERTRSQAADVGGGARAEQH